MNIQKDEVLDHLANRGNVAQFVSYRPGPEGLVQSFSRLAGQEPNTKFDGLRDAASQLLLESAQGTVNVRSFSPQDPRSRQFFYGLETADLVASTAETLAAEGLHLILNETVDIHDGGVSGVVQGGVMEFAPDDTPRCVEKGGTVSLPYDMAMELLELVYGFRPDVQSVHGERSEFSIHPAPRGWRKGHTLLWEHEVDLPDEGEARMHWPNHFSRMLGDKAFGLLMAHLAGVPVPRTLVIGRRIAPFSFGTATGTLEVWTRTCPVEPQPGLFTTIKGWTDPFALLSNEDPHGNAIASVLRQDAVPAQHSGAAIVAGDGTLAIEGRIGEGDRFMLGVEPPQALPSAVHAAVTATFEKLHSIFGPVKFEWVHDGERVWVVQLHRGATESRAEAIVPGEAATWAEFRVEDGLDKLRQLLTELPSDGGIAVVGDVGLTSHIADVLRRAGRPAKVWVPAVL